MCGLYLMCVCAAGVAEAATYPLDLTKTRYLHTVHSEGTGIWKLSFVNLLLLRFLIVALIFKGAQV